MHISTLFFVRHPYLKQSYLLGVILVVISAIVFSTVGIFVKGVETDAWGVIFWRGLSAAIFTIIYTAFAGTLRSEWSRFGWPALFVALLAASGTIAFIPAFKYTSIANVAVIWSTSPFVAAFFTWIILRERPRRKILIASVITMVGVGIVVSGSVSTGSSLFGDMLAFWMVLMIAAMFTVYRIWPDTPAALPAALSSVVLLPISFYYADPILAHESELTFLIAFGLIFAIASVTMAEGAKRIPATEVALIGSIELPLAPIWAFLLLAESPTRETMVGGLIILFAVLWSQWPAKTQPHI
jgi:drug/metabolite transporter (DMT)-like permease